MGQGGVPGDPTYPGQLVRLCRVVYSPGQLVSAAGTGIKTTVEANSLDPRLPQKVEIAIFRITQEALNNTARYARAGAVTLSVKPHRDRVLATFADDGVGFDMEQVLGDDEREHWGVLTMRERAAAIGAERAFETSPGGDTCVKLGVGRQE